MKKSLQLSVFLLFLLFQSAYANTFTEVGDAGQLLNTAQIVTGSGELTTIIGSLTGYNDVDLYYIYIYDTDAFSVEVYSSLSVDDDTTLWLFNSSGELVIYDHQSGGYPIPEFISGCLSGYDAGYYFLALSLFDTHNLGSPLEGWSTDPDPQQTGSYTLELTGVSFVPVATVPEPATMLLFGIGLLSIAGATRIKRMN